LRYKNDFLELESKLEEKIEIIKGISKQFKLSFDAIQNSICISDGEIPVFALIYKILENNVYIHNLGKEMLKLRLSYDITFPNEIPSYSEQAVLSLCSKVCANYNINKNSKIDKKDETILLLVKQNQDLNETIRNLKIELEKDPK
jgi:hypothetical protein